MTYYKHPRTPHMLSSPGATDDDVRVSGDRLRNARLVVSEKMDGGNVTLYPDSMHARSTNSPGHVWDAPVKGLWGAMRHRIPDGWRITGESLYARRSVSYDNLPSVLMVFAVWDEHNRMLAWEDMERWVQWWGMVTVPVLYRGVDVTEACAVWHRYRDPATSEGFVVRNADAFHYNDFRYHVMKYVRAHHVQTHHHHWQRHDFPTNTFRAND